LQFSAGRVDASELEEAGKTPLAAEPIALNLANCLGVSTVGQTEQVLQPLKTSFVPLVLLSLVESLRTRRLCPPMHHQRLFGLKDVISVCPKAGRKRQLIAPEEVVRIDWYIPRLIGMAR
jgi:hypothetical protein